MKRFAKPMLFVLAACVLAFALAACSSHDDPYAAAGTYKMVSIQSDDPSGAVSADDAALLDAVGLSTVLELGDDGTGTFTLLGVPTAITWENTTFVIDGTATQFTLSGSTLSIVGSDGRVMVFQKQ